MPGQQSPAFDYFPNNKNSFNVFNNCINNFQAMQTLKTYSAVWQSRHDKYSSQKAWSPIPDKYAIYI